MDPEKSSQKQIPETTSKPELTSLCSCNECDTLRCFSTKRSTTNKNHDEEFSKTCIYFTNITIKRSNSNNDTSTSENTTNKRMPPCETCRQDEEIEKNNKNTKSGSVPKDEIKTKSSVCKLCKRIIHDINDAVHRRCDKNIPHSTNMSVKRKNGKTETDKSNIASHSINTKKPKSYTDVTNKEKSICEDYVKISSLNKEKPPLEAAIKRKSECEICNRNSKKYDNADVVSNNSRVTNLINARNSVCEVCLKNINKINDNVINKESKKGLVPEVCKFNVKHNKDEPRFTLAGNTNMNKPKCLTDIQPKCSICAIKYGTVPREKMLNKKSVCDNDFQNNKDTYGRNNETGEKLYTKRSKCKVCRQDNSIMRKIYKTDSRKSTCNNYGENFENDFRTFKITNKCLPKNENYDIKSKCHNCSKNIKTNEKMYAVNSDLTGPEISAEVKQKCSNCGRNIDVYCKVDGVNSVVKLTKIKSKCRNCSKVFETYGYIDDSGKKIKTDHEANNAVDAKCSKCKQINSGCFSRYNLAKKIPIHTGKSLILCTCKNHENFSQVKLARESPAINVHNATVNYVRKDINPGAAKLSAQIMNVPYDEFKESFYYGNEADAVAKTKIKNNLSDEIIKRIKDIYRACSCKVCECIAGKSLKLDNVCNCKPCDCDDCKSYKNLDYFAVLRDESKLSCYNTDCHKEECFDISRKTLNQSCGCKPCDCIKCMHPKTIFAARVSENRQANCSCTPCRCLECERNFFSLSTHLTREMSTGMVRNCRCDQCLDQRCRGAGGTDDCRCEMPSKAIFKPVEKDSHDYDIRHASVYQPRNKKCDNFDTIAMYASVSSNFPPLGTLKEACSCEDCECIACNNEDGKLSIETILKPQHESHTHSVKTNNCVCKSCECEVCSYEKALPGCDIKYQDAVCVCDECDCINCQSMARSSTTAKVSGLAKPIGKIYNKNSFQCGSQQCDDSDLTTTASSRIYSNKKGHHLCMNATLDRNCFMKNNDSDLKDIMQCHGKDQNTCLYAKTLCNFQDLEDKQLPSRDTSICNKNSQNDLCFKLKNVNKASNYIVYTGKEDSVPYNRQFQTSVENTTNQYQNEYVEDSKNSERKIEMSPSVLSIYKSNSSKTTLETCLKDILTFGEDLNIKAFKIAHNKNKLKIIDNKRTDQFEHGIEPFSSLHHNLKKGELNGVEMPTIIDGCKQSNDHFISDIPLVLKNKQLNWPVNQIDYEGVHKTLKKAKDFSSQLIKLLEKYERANKDFQSVSEKLKLSHGLNICNKLDYVIIVKDNHENYISHNIVKKENEGKVDTEKKSCIFHVPINNLKEFYDWRSTSKDSLIITNSEKHDSSIKRNQNLEQKNLDLIEKIIHPQDCDIEKWHHHGDKVPNIQGNINSKDSKILSELYQRPIGSCTITAKDNIIEEYKSFFKPDENIIQSTQNNSNFEENTNTNQLNKLVMPSDRKIQNNTMELVSTNNIQTQIDILTDQLSEMIMDNVMKNYEELPFSKDCKKYNILDDFNELKLQQNELNRSHDRSLNMSNYYINNHQKTQDSFTSPFSDIPLKLEMQSISVQASIDRDIYQTKVEKVIKSAASHSKTTQVEKECYITGNFVKDKHLQKKDQRKSSNNTLKSGTQIDLKYNPQYNVAYSSRICELTKSKCECEDLKVCSLSGRRVSDHTVMVKWGKPKEMNGVQGFELLVDGRPVQKIIDSARCMAVVTCLPNCDKVLLTMRTVLDVPLRSGHKPTVTIIYRPRLRKNKNEDIN